MAHPPSAGLQGSRIYGNCPLINHYKSYIYISAIFYYPTPLDPSSSWAPSSAHAAEKRACPRGRSLSSTNLFWHPADGVNPAFVDCAESPEDLVARKVSVDLRGCWLL